MNWEEIETEERPVTFLECAILTRFGGVVPKGEWWCWDFENPDTACECLDRLKPGKYELKGLRISLKEPPMANVWTVQLCLAQQSGMVHSQVFRAFPTPEKLTVLDESNLFSKVLWNPDFEQKYLIQAYLGIQKYREDRPNERSVHCPFVIPSEFLKPGTPPLLCIISQQEVK